MPCDQARPVPGILSSSTLPKGQHVDFREIRLLKGVWRSHGAWRAQHLVTDQLAEGAMAEWPLGEMRVHSAVDQEIRGLIHTHGRLTFAQFMRTCLYSPRGGFYASRDTRISTHFGTAPTSHPVFGALLARQLEHMWHLLGDPPVFHVIEVGSGDGALSQSISRLKRSSGKRVPLSNPTHLSGSSLCARHFGPTRESIPYLLAVQ
jgi:hypothetical protein